MILAGFVVLSPAAAGESSCFALSGDLLSFASPKRNVSKEKATRFLRPGYAGQPALLTVSGVLLKLATLRQSQALNPETAALLGALNGNNFKSQGLSSSQAN